MNERNPKSAPSSEKNTPQNSNLSIDKSTSFPMRGTNLARRQFSSTLSFFKQCQPHPLPKLRLLDDLVQLTKNTCPNLFTNTVIVGYQHLLETTGSLFQALIQAGVKAENIFILGKCYSTAPSVVEAIKKLGVTYVNPGTIPSQSGCFLKTTTEDAYKLWQAVQNTLHHDKSIESVLILDDGAIAAETLPIEIALNYSVAIVEQTRKGLYSQKTGAYQLPVVEVASSAAKRNLEPPLIAIAIMRRVNAVLDQLKIVQSTMFGVAGYGAIGQAITQFLLQQGYRVYVFDSELPSQLPQHIRLKFTKSMAELFNIADIIFGCTGQDITRGLKFDTHTTEKKLISCSSSDVEFNYYLQKIKKQSIIIIDPLETVSLNLDINCTITIMGGGFPFNFDGRPWTVPADQIESTQGLLFSALVQARLVACKAPKSDLENLTTLASPSIYRQMLHPLLQQFVALHWLPQVTSNETINQQKKELLKKFSNLAWIIKNSGGQYQDNPELTQYFLPEVQKLKLKIKEAQKNTGPYDTHFGLKQTKTNDSNLSVSPTPTNHLPHPEDHQLSPHKIHSKL